MAFEEEQTRIPKTTINKKIKDIPLPLILRKKHQVVATDLHILGRDWHTFTWQDGMLLKFRPPVSITFIMQYP